MSQCKFNNFEIDKNCLKGVTIVNLWHIYGKCQVTKNIVELYLYCQWIINKYIYTSLIINYDKDKYNF